MDRPRLNLSRYLVLMLKEVLFSDFMKQPCLSDQLPRLRLQSDDHQSAVMAFDPVHDIPQNRFCGSIHVMHIIHQQDKRFRLFLKPLQQ